MISDFFDYADAETRHIVIFAVIHARHFRRLAADQRAAGLQAAFGNTVDHAGGGIDIQFTRGIVIEENSGSAP